MYIVFPTYLIFQEKLKVVDKILSKIQDRKYVRGSDEKMTKFKDCVSDVGIDTNIGLRLDMSIRWNFTYLMFKSALKYEKVFEYFQTTD